MSRRTLVWFCFSSVDLHVQKELCAVSNIRTEEFVYSATRSKRREKKAPVGLSLLVANAYSC